MTRVVNMEVNEAEVEEVERLRPKVGRIPANLRLLNEQDMLENDHSTSTHKSDTHFMFLLVGLFIIVNLVLVTLLNHREKNAPAQVPVVAQGEPAKPVAPAVPVATVPVQVAPVSVKPVADAQPPVVAVKPVLPPAPPAPSAPAVPRAYVTPVSAATTKSVAAPVQHVIVSEPAPQAAAVAEVKATEVKTPEVKAQDNLVVVHTPAPAAATLPAVSPSAGTQTKPAAISPATATQDLLSVINKD